MKKHLLSILFVFLCINIYSLDSQIDILTGGFFNYTSVSGVAAYDEYINYNSYEVDGDYRAIFKSGGGSLGFDLFFDSCPFGLYFRAGFMGVSGVDRTAGGHSVALDNTEPNLNMFYDLGGVFSYEVNNYISLCAAPAVSMLYITSEYRNFKNIYNPVATIDSVLGVGLTADIYAKLRYKYFSASAGCAASFYPVALVTSKDSNIDYSSNIRETMAYNIRPYISIGFTFKEHTALNIAPAN